MSAGIVFISLLFMGLGLIVQSRLKSKFSAYSKVPTSSGLSGKEVAEKMLHDNGIFDVSVVSVQGFLSDHYDPLKKSIKLSPHVYEGRNVSATAVAAHECGHAVQHAANYPMLMLRSMLVPVVQISSNLAQWILLIGLGLFSFGGGNQTLLLIGIILFGASALFAVITLPVEFDASARALQWLENSHVTSLTEQEKAKDDLKWATLTYVVAALASIAMLSQYILIYPGELQELRSKPK
jgi:Zn-dependent membrane protease YugP